MQPCFFHTTLVAVVVGCVGFIIDNYYFSCEKLVDLNETRRLQNYTSSSYDFILEKKDLTLEESKASLNAKNAMFLYKKGGSQSCLAVGMQNAKTLYKSSKPVRSKLI
jgi:hypothetical protein